MKKEMTLDKILFWLTLISPVFAFSLACLIGEVKIFGVNGMIRYSWVMWFFIPIGILSIIMGFKLKRNKQKHKKNLIVGFICVPVLIIFGSYRFIFSNFVSYDVIKLYLIEETTNITLPHEIKIITEKSDEYDISYVKITNKESKKNFEGEIKNSELWKNELSLRTQKMLPIIMQNEIQTFDYFLFYNLTTKEYNVTPRDRGVYDTIIMAYDLSLNRLMIINNYTISLNNYY